MKSATTDAVCIEKYMYIGQSVVSYYNYGKISIHFSVIKKTLLA